MSEVRRGLRSKARLRPSLRWSQSFRCPRLFSDTTVPLALVDRAIKSPRASLFWVKTRFDPLFVALRSVIRLVISLFTCLMTLLTCGMQESGIMRDTHIFADVLVIISLMSQVRLDTTVSPGVWFSKSA